MAIQTIQAKTILNKTKKRDDWFLDDYTLNPYSACSFNCLYCYIRGSKYGYNMAEKLAVKENAVELLAKQLALHARKGRYGIVVLASATDPYLQFEKELRLTRKLLGVLLQHKFPVHVITKSDLAERDFDLLHQIANQGILPVDLQGRLSTSALITFSFSTLDPDIASIFEPGATHPANRLLTLKSASSKGFMTGVSLMPLLPYLTDTDEQLEKMYTAFCDAGARYIMPASLTLFGDQPHDSLPLVFRAIEKHYPDLLPRYRDLYTDPRKQRQYQLALQARTQKFNDRFKIPSRIME
jgi:DNA repair photolyase